MVGCSGWIGSQQGIEFCESMDDYVGIFRECDWSSSSDVGTLLIAVQSEEFEGDCDSYGLKVIATYVPEIPTY